ncbi:MAG: flavodoxin family protein [Methanomassiliicoccales archaeon]|nr:flavodoxin family protein [Methanomassiliicoccales archaeon]
MIGILGSPRRGGNCDILLDECLRGAKESGAAVRKYFLRDLKIAPCQGCNTCLTTGECIVADNMREVHRALLEADAVIVATPIYFSGPTCTTKCMIDRCQCLWARERLLGIKGKPRKGAMILVGGDPKAVFRNAQSEIKAFFAGVGITFHAELLVAGVEKMGEIRTREEELRQAWRLGQGLA